MPRGIDRRIGSNGGLTALVALLAVLALAAGGYLWYRTTGGLAPSGAPVRIPVRFDEPLSVTLVLPNSSALALQMTTVKRQPDTQSQAREVLTALLSDTRSQSPVLSGVKLRSFFLDSSGTAFIDIVPLSPGGVKASAWEELLGLYAFVNTLTQNFEEIKQVRFLLEGREAQSLAGHIDLARTFTRRDDLGKP